MDIEELIQRIRDHYVEQFKAFVAWQRQALGEGAGEVKFQLNGGEGLFQNLCCVDFVANVDGQASVREMQADRVLNFAPFTGAMDDADIEVRDLRWDDVIVDHDIQTAVNGLEGWFDTWFDPEDKRYDPEAELSGSIHSLSVSPGRVTADFGTAPPEAFWDLMKLLLDAGAEHIRISCTEGR